MPGHFHQNRARLVRDALVELLVAGSRSAAAVIDLRMGPGLWVWLNI